MIEQVPIMIVYNLLIAFPSRRYINIIIYYCLINTKSEKNDDDFFYNFFIAKCKHLNILSI